MEPTHPLSATHTMEGVPSLVASQYSGTWVVGEESERLVETATLEPRLEQIGQGAPTVRVALRHGYGKQRIYEDDRLVLSIDDDRELMTLLSSLIDMADKG